jgi:hypothetical protein
VSSLTVRAVGTKAAAFAAALTLLCCAPEDVVVANVHDAGAAQNDARPFGKSCTTNDECGLSSYCERAACGDPTGVCQVIPTFCDSQRAPVCACDGVTFWNDCLRRSRGETASIAGICESGAADCGGPMKKTCALLGASCAKLVPPDAKCDGPIKDMIDGHCWILPLVCPPSDPMDPRWATCGGPMPPPMDCRGTCEAIRTSEPHRQLLTPGCPP